MKKTNRALVILLLFVILAALPARSQAAPTAHAWVANTLNAHNAWDPDGAVLAFVPGQPKGYSEGDTVAFRVTIDGTADAQQLKFMICLDLDNSGAFAFTALEPWNTSFTPGSPPASVSAPVSGVSAANGVIDAVTFLGEAGAHDGQTCPANYLGWLVEFTVTNAAQDTYIVYGGHLATPGDPYNTGTTSGTVPAGQGASSTSGVFQARIQTANGGDKTVNFSPDDILGPAAVSLVALGAAGDVPSWPWLAALGLLLLALSAAVVARSRTR